MYDNNEISQQSKQYVKELSSLSNADIEKIERVCNALQQQFQAEAAKESQQKMRILFQRAAQEWLPFIIYCITFSPVAVASIWNITSLEGWQLIISWIGLIVVMLIPVLFATLLKRKTVGNNNSQHSE